MGQDWSIFIDEYNSILFMFSLVEILEVFQYFTHAETLSGKDKVCEACFKDFRPRSDFIKNFCEIKKKRRDEINGEN